MVAGSEHDTLEPELESGHFRVMAAGGAGPHWPHQLSDYQRLMVNPFLFVLAPILYWIVHSFLRVAELPPFPLIVFVFIAVWLGFSRWLIQYHCLDCGETRPLRSWKDHACDAVKERADHDERPWFRPPNAAMQTKLWLLSLISFLIGYVAYFRS